MRWLHVRGLAVKAREPERKPENSCRSWGWDYSTATQQCVRGGDKRIPEAPHPVSLAGTWNFGLREEEGNYGRQGRGKDNGRRRGAEKGEGGKMEKKGIEKIQIRGKEKRGKEGRGRNERKVGKENRS